MTTEYASLPADITVGEGLQRLRRIAPDSETIYYVYITDANRHLNGYTTLREMVLARPDQYIMEVLRQPLISMPVDSDQEEVARAIQRYDFLALPIVDSENRLVGIVTHDDVIDVLEEEATEDAQRMGAVQPIDTPYLRAGFWQLAWRRGAWLMLLFLGELFTGTALRHYSGTLEAMVSLVFFIPVIISAGGNSGSQSATLVTSVGTARQRRPVSATSRRVSSSRSARRAPITMSAPASASPRAKATPRPDDAPVTTATLPSRRKLGGVLRARTP